MPDPTIADELAAAVGVLETAGVLNARREATAIWAALAGRSMGDVWIVRENPAPEDAAARFRDAVTHRASGAPFAYAVGVAGFRRLELLVDPRVLIPRPETERLVDHVLGFARAWGGEGERQVADIGTGSGCIALSLAVEGPFERVIATDISPGALDVAFANAERVAPGVTVEFRNGSLLAPLVGDMFEVIVSNPPYVTEEEFARLDHGVRGYEPREALIGGADGMSHTGDLLAGAGAFLIPGGLLALEVDSTRADAALGLARTHGWADVRIEPDLFGLRRYLLAIKERS